MTEKDIRKEMRESGDIKGRILVGIPTRDRPEYLSALLSTLMFQSTRNWDLLIVDTTTEKRGVEEDPQVSRYLRTITALGHGVDILRVPNGSRSSVTAVNTILVEAAVREYGYVFKIDDDHILPPAALEQMQGFLRHRNNTIICGVTPWMHVAWEGAAAPEEVLVNPVGQPTTVWSASDDFPYVEVTCDHFYRWRLEEGKSTIVPSKLGADANFMMKPDARILRSDVGLSCVHACTVWFLQLRALLGYQIYFDVSLNVWHVAAPGGGVREEDGNHVKQSEWDLQRKKLVAYLLKEFDMEKPDLPHYSKAQPPFYER